MFKKIRNRILLLNMAMVSTVVIVAFMVILLVTYASMQRLNLEKLSSDPLPQRIVYGETTPQGDTTFTDPAPDGAVLSGFTRRISPDAGLSFSILVDAQSQIVGINSMVDLEQETYEQAVLAVTRAKSGQDTIRLDSRIWRFSISQVAVIYRSIANSAISITPREESLTHIQFLDVTDSHRMIRSLALMLTGLTAVILTVFFFISRFFANRSIRPMAQAWEKQGRFIADASHELKTPLSIINSNCGALYAGQEETVGSQVKWVDSIMRASDRMTGLLDKLLSMARMEDAQIQLQRFPFNLSEAVTDAVSEIDAAALEKGLDIQRQIEAGIEIESDRERVWQILSILLDNAVKYTESGGILTVSLKRERRQIICAVKNSGDGIPAKDLPLLFDRFYRGDPARSSENGGYGLGLAIAKAVSEQLGARLLAGGKPGEYAEFSLLLNAES